MKLNTHDRTPRPEDSKLIKGLFVLSSVLMYSIFGLLSFACFYYANSFAGGVCVILIPALLTIVVLIRIKDMEKAYVEIKGNVIYVVDYYWGVKKEQRFSFSDITSTEICVGYSNKVKGYRYSFAGMRYIVFNQGEKYLFKIICLPETKEIFGQFIR